MARRRRGRERAMTQAQKVGQSVRLARATIGMTRAVASSRAGIARSTWDRVESGDTHVTLANLVAAADAVGLDLVCQLYPGRGPSLRDSGQLAIAQWLAAVAAPAWRVTLEERAGEHGEAVDMVLWGSMEVLAFEIERSARDWQAQSRRASIKRDWLAQRHARPIRLVIAVSDTKANRATLTPFAPVIGLAFPAGSRAVLRAVRSGQPLGADGMCWIRHRSR